MSSVSAGYFKELFDSHRGRTSLDESSCIRIFAVYALPDDIAKRKHLAAPGVPQLGQAHPYDDSLVVTDISGGNRLSEDVVTVIVTYSNLPQLQPWRLSAISYSRDVPWFERIQFNPVDSASAASSTAITPVYTSHWLQKVNQIPTPRSVLEYEVHFPYDRTRQYAIGGADLDAILIQRGQIHRMSIPFAVSRITSVEGTVTEWQFQGAHISSSDTGKTAILYTWVSDSATPAQVLTPGSVATDFVLAPYRPPFFEYRIIAQVKTQGPSTPPGGPNIQPPPGEPNIPGVNPSPPSVNLPSISGPGIAVYDPWSGNRNNVINPNGQGWRNLKGMLH